MFGSRNVRVLLSLLTLGIGACGGEPPSVDDPELGAITGGPVPRALTVQSVAPARPVPTTDGKRHLLYELVLTNASPAVVRLTAVDVFDADCPQTTLATFKAEALSAILQVQAGDVTTGTIAAGAQAVLFFELAQPLVGRLPTRLGHRLSTAPVAGQRGSVMAGPTVPVINERPRPVSPPLHGSNLIDLNGCCRSAHTRALIPFNNQLFLAQRYAIDFLRLSDEGELYAGDPTKNESYFTYGNEIAAATGGHIVDRRDGVPDNVLTEPLPDATVESAPGNYVLEALDDGRFALYAHMKPGSVKVQVGDRVARGQVLGLVGNTGNSTAPHLHFHVTDGPSPLLSNGLPYVFDHFDLQATIDLADPNADVVFTPPPQQRRDLLPKAGDIVAFP